MLLIPILSDFNSSLLFDKTSGTPFLVHFGSIFGPLLVHSYSSDFGINQTSVRAGGKNECIILQGESSTKYETNVNVCPEKDHVSTMLVKGSSSSRVRINASEENGSGTPSVEAKTNVEPEEFDSSESHQSLLMEGMNQLRLKNHLLDVKLKAQGRVFKVRRFIF